MPLYLRESEVASLVTPADAVEAVEGSLRRMGEGEVEIAPRRRLQLEEGSLADMAAVRSRPRPRGREGVCGLGAGRGVRRLPVRLVAASSRSSRRTPSDSSGPAPRAVSRRAISRKREPGSLGVIGCGFQAETQVSCIRAALPSLDRVVAYCRTPERLADFCSRTGAEPAESHRDAAEQDVVVTITSSKDPVLRGEWLQAGALVVAAGANHPSRRELDNVVLERAAFVCCDWLEQARIESGDLIEPVAAGTLDWLEVHELHEVVTGEVHGRQSDADIVVFKSNGLASWDVALAAEVVSRARERGVGTTM